MNTIPNGTTTNAIVSQSVNLGSGDTTLLLQNTAPNSSFVMSPYTDDNTAPTTGNAKVRIIHSSFSANPLDVYILTGNDIGGWKRPIRQFGRFLPNPKHIDMAGRTFAGGRHAKQQPL